MYFKKVRWISRRIDGYSDWKNGRKKYRYKEKTKNMLKKQLEKKRFGKKIIMKKIGK